MYKFIEKLVMAMFFIGIAFVFVATIIKNIFTSKEK